MGAVLYIFFLSRFSPDYHGDSQSFNLYYITSTTATSLRSLPHSVTFSKQKCVRREGLPEGNFSHSTEYQQRKQKDFQQ
ncbi:MAG: hypothetical protein D3925_03895 [Candidatus Electrothrix sp. AR5]|nr:hypothetical protein [Candidatus Electrothrix sp. AR5]